MTYQMIVDNDQYQQVVEFTLDYDGTTLLTQHAVTVILRRWAEQKPQDRHWVIDAKGMLRLQFTDKDGRHLVNEAPFDGDWNLPIAWLANALPTGTLWWGQSIGQPNVDAIVAVSDAVDKLMDKYDQTGMNYSWTDIKLAATEAAYMALAAS